ncbi:universal stress protein family [Azotobacter vinelandii CA]|uniref:Universal stress protein family n=2 Tax=Azotobacter vinelandii TaxID=354 RepID=C1DSN9_AZOVD|nr:universal stress protein [Azotobacter vinelandii]ACO79982.1 universal stress protein family [Azotobacter vinelandii DJ]AGK14509.1 universal stress protein family [Azotobacter vinelandii CA]AGK21638.1 universal stress protein family [Azotobacter vinelandii CA6]WKN20722.1 universal stress protein [Azotobacter vinelandii]SFX17220.1 universal stress protein E [Azotobacter vinelandii]
MNLRQLLVVIDPAQEPQPALERAVWLARHGGAALELLACEFEQNLDGSLLFDERQHEQARSALLAHRQARLEELAAPLRAEGLQVRTEVRWGRPLHRTILGRIEELKPDLVFKAATRNHGLLRRLLLGNTCWQLLRHCPVPLWLAHHGQWQGRRLCAALDPLHDADKPAQLDQRLIATARELGERLRMDAHYLHCHAPLPRSLVFDAELVATYDAYVERGNRQHRQAFERLLAPYAIPASHRHLEQGYPEEVIPRFVRDRQIDLLLMGAIARGHLDNALIGNTAERVLEALECDLLILKPQPWESSAARQ